MIDLIARSVAMDLQEKLPPYGSKLRTNWVKRQHFKNIRNSERKMEEISPSCQDRDYNPTPTSLYSHTAIPL